MRPIFVSMIPPLLYVTPIEQRGMIFIQTNLNNNIFFFHFLKVHYNKIYSRKYISKNIFLTSLAWSKNHVLADVALVIVSCVVNV